MSSLSALTPFGDGAVRFVVPSRIAARRVLFERLRALPGVRDVVLCEEVGCVVLGEATAQAVERALAEPVAVTDAPVAKHEVRVVYDGEDLTAVAVATGASVERVIALHRERDYVVSMLGFLPGFAYLRGLAPELVLPRRAPRPRVPARSVAIGAEYTGIYPIASAGGWHLLGRALDAPRFALGDAVTFVAADAAPAEASPPAQESTPSGPHLLLTRVAGLALFVDGGRDGRMHEGMPPGGPLVRGLFAAANASAGSSPTACAIELTGILEVEARGGEITVADDERCVTLRDGDRFTLASGKSRARYLAVEGGFDAPIIDGGRGALLAAGIGRPLQRGDAIALGSERGERSETTPAPLADSTILVAPGPDATDAALECLLAGEHVVSTVSDRTGTRLTGAAPAASAGTRPSAPMVEGAIELTPSGFVVLGPDHPTTGGYPVVAVLRAQSRDAFFARPLGSRVRFAR